MEVTEMTTKSDNETRNLGRKIAKEVREGGLLCLYGNLGSGKTTFTQGLAEGLGIERRVNSPTFIIMRSYEINSDLLFEHQRELTRKNFSLRPKNKKIFYHLDLYRIASEQDLEGLGVKEILEDKENILVIEWPEKIKHFLPTKRVNIYFDYISDSERSIKVEHN